MRRDPRVFLIGEDVAEAGHPFKTLLGLVHFLNTRDVLPRCGTAMTEAEALDDAGIGGFLKDDDIGGRRTNDVEERLLAARAAALDVVAQEPDRQSCFSTSVRYGWPSSSPRRYMTKSRVPWMFTGRSTIAMSSARSCCRTASGSASSARAKSRWWRRTGRTRPRWSGRAGG